MPTLEECGTNLGVCYAERAQLNLRIWRAGQAIEARARELRPESGWPGKNDEARAAAKDAALAGDQMAQNAAADLTAAREKLAGVEADIDTIEADRRALEWRIRERMVEALTRQGVDTQSRGDRMEAGFDDKIQQEIDHAAAGGLDDLEPGIGSDGIEYPF